MFDSTDGGIYGDIMLHYIAENAEWCAAYMPQELYGYGTSQEDALQALRVALGVRREELAGYMRELDTPRAGQLIDLDTYRRHKERHAIQTAKPDGT